MSEQQLPTAARFTVLEEKFKHGQNVFRRGNTYEVEDYPDIDATDVKMFHAAGWVSVEGWPDPPARDPNRVLLRVGKQVVGLKSKEV